MPSQKISKLESKAYEYFTEIFEDSKKTIKDYEEKLEKGEKSILGEGHNERIIKNTKEYLDKLSKSEEMFLRLKEKYKHKNAKDRVSIYEDWFDYCMALKNVKFAGKMLDYDFEENSGDRYDDSVKEPFIMMEEIEKRFKKLLEIKD